MKKLYMFAFVCAVAVSMGSCNKDSGDNSGKSSEDSSLSSEDEDYEPEAVYEEAAFEIDDVIDPYDDDAYRQYGSNSQSGGSEEYTGPSDVDMLDVNLTEPYYIDMAMDQLEYEVGYYKELLNNDPNNYGQIAAVEDHLVKLLDHVQNASDVMTYEQTMRLLDIAQSFGE